VHLQGNFNLVLHLESTKVVCQLFSICVLLEERSGSNLLLTGSVALGYGAAASVRTRNILAANLVSVNKSVNYIANAKLDGCIAMSEAVVQRRDRKEQTVRLLSAETDCGYVSLIGVHISTDVVTGIVLLTYEVVLLCELCGQLTVGGEVYTHLSLGIVEGYTYSITKHIRKEQTVGIRMLTHIG
jgi:hypothetical protein